MYTGAVIFPQESSAITTKTARGCSHTQVTHTLHSTPHKHVLLCVVLWQSDT